jgi:hypothetical protein
VTSSSVRVEMAPIAALPAFSSFVPAIIDGEQPECVRELG